MLNNRLFCEIALLKQFKEKHNYLSKYEILEDDPLKISFSLLVHGYTYDFTAVFNRYFPDIPIRIIAETDFHSSHQYKDNTMCLRWGQDNWDDEITLVKLIENLYELLDVENPLGEEHKKAESGDRFTIGQELRRGESLSIIIPFPLSDFHSSEGCLSCSLEDGAFDDRLTFIVSEIDGREVYKTGLKKMGLTYHISCKNLGEMDIDEIKSEYSVTEGRPEIVFSAKGKALLFFWNDGVCKTYRLNCLVNDYEIKKRVGIDETVLNKRITIIGLGSVGSRIAMDLARAGFSNFYFVDDDIMLPFNVVRHELTNEDVGAYKVNALKKKIKDSINEKAQIEVSTLAMTGQESSSSTSRFIENCSKSSLIIDCTAYDPILLMLSQMTEEKNIPVISGTVIPGGLGNIVLIKKGSGANMESVLASYYQWKNDKDIFAEKVDDYSSNIDEQTFTATMSDCSILSGLIGKFAIQILNGKEDDLYNINILSTSDYRSLSEFFNVFKVNANSLAKKEEEYDPDLIKEGKEIYENYSSKKHS